MLQLRSLLLIRMFQGLYQHIGFLVAQDIPTYIFTKYGSITVYIQQIVFQLKSDTHIHAKVIQPFRIFSRGTAQQCSDFQTCRQQHGCFQTNHLQVFLLLHIAPLLKIHIHLLTRKLIPLMEKGSRIVNMVSCTYAIGRLDFPDFFHLGKRGGFWRIPVYSNTKLALTLFTVNLANRVKEKGIVVNAADPGIVSTDIITMHMWFDPLTDILFRPFIRTPRQGAATAVHLLLDEDAGKRTGTLNASCRPKHLSGKYTRHVQMQELWNRTEKIVEKWL
jgi:hypothetical protein